MGRLVFLFVIAIAFLLGPLIMVLFPNGDPVWPQVTEWLAKDLTRLLVLVVVLGWWRDRRPQRGHVSGREPHRRSDTQEDESG